MTSTPVFSFGKGWCRALCCILLCHPAKSTVPFAFGCPCKNPPPAPEVEHLELGFLPFLPTSCRKGVWLRCLEFALTIWMYKLHPNPLAKPGHLLFLLLPCSQRKALLTSSRDPLRVRRQYQEPP